jgi:N-acetylmuramoyl-L-alanine amidase
VSTHEVKQGECLETIAAQHGWLAQALWDQPENAKLKEQRKDMHCLAPGDVVTVPTRRPRGEPVPTDGVGRFQLAVELPKLRVRLLDDAKPRAGEAYKLEYDDGQLLEGSTDGDGWVEQPLPVSVRKAELVLKDGAERYALAVGSLDPADVPSGAQGRLHNLGYYFGELDGELGPMTAAALKRFQQAKGLDATGALDEATAEALRGEYGG